MDKDRSVEVFGFQDRNLRLLEDSLSITIIAANNRLKITGAEKNIQIAEKLLRFLSRIQEPVNRNELKFYIRQFKKDLSFDPNILLEQSLKVSSQGKIVRARSAGQATYMQSIKKDHVIFAIGPAGTGKTYLAMAFAVNQLIDDKISRIVLVRPVVEAGESLGFLPGDLNQKINPYLRPLYDALFEMIGFEAYTEYTELGRIEVAPLAYMRGRTLNNSVIILDEAQNTTTSQMKMFLTRLGLGSKAIITGDVTQVDLPSKMKSGLIHAEQVLQSVPDMSFIHFTKQDVVRHKLVQDIIEAYELHEGQV